MCLLWIKSVADRSAIVFRSFRIVFQSFRDRLSIVSRSFRGGQFYSFDFKIFDFDVAFSDRGAIVHTMLLSPLDALGNE